MLDPFAKLAEAGFSQQGGLITAGPVTEHWTPELIASLDWMRVSELVRAIAAHFLSSSLRSAFRHLTSDGSSLHQLRRAADGCFGDAS